MTSKRWAQAGMVFLAAMFVLWAAYFIFRSSFIATDGRRYFSLFDDAMISMRYAWNFSHGAGLVWNPGERVEGYTNLLMVLFMSVWTGLLGKSQAVLAVQVTGIPILLGIAILGRLHWVELAKGREIRHARDFSSLAFMGCLLYYPLAYWTLMGMETGLLTVLLLAGSLQALVHMRTGDRRPMLGAAVALGLCYLARPDSALVAALLLGVAALLAPGDLMKRSTTALLSLSIYMLFPVTQTIFRIAYYGAPVPLTYVLKATGMPLAMRIENGLGYTRLFLQEARWAYFLGISGGVLGLSRRKAFLTIPPVALLAYQVMIGGDVWRYWRLVAPGVPYLMLLTLGAVDWLLASLGRLRTWRARTVLRRRLFGHITGQFRLLPTILGLVAVVMLLASVTADLVYPGSPGFGYAQRHLLLAAVLTAFLATVARVRPILQLVGFSVAVMILRSLNQTFLPEAILYQLPYQVWNNKNHVDVSLSIERYTTEDATVGVIWAGIIPYYTSRYAIDFLGKNDPYIARLPADTTGAVSWSGMYSVPGHNKYDLEYSIRQRRPTYVEGFAWGSQDLSHVFEESYVEVSLPGPDPAFRRGDPSVRWDLIDPEKLIYP